MKKLPLILGILISLVITGCGLSDKEHIGETILSTSGSINRAMFEELGTDEDNGRYHANYATDKTYILCKSENRTGQYTILTGAHIRSFREIYGTSFGRDTNHIYWGCDILDINTGTFGIYKEGVDIGFDGEHICYRNVCFTGRISEDLAERIRKENQGYYGYDEGNIDGYNDYRAGVLYILENPNCESVKQKLENGKRECDLTNTQCITGSFGEWSIESGKVYESCEKENPDWREIVGADPESFKMINELYAIDKDHVFCTQNNFAYGSPPWKVIAGVDLQTFRLWSNGSEEVRAKDKNNVYYYCESVKGADPRSFEIIGEDYDSSVYAKDKNNVYCSKGMTESYIYPMKKILGADIQTFKMQSKEQYEYKAQDKSRVYEGCSPKK